MDNQADHDNGRDQLQLASGTERRYKQIITAATYSVCHCRVAPLQQQLRPSVRFSHLASDLAPGPAIESVPPAQACQWHTGTVALSEDRHSDGPSECFCAVRVSTRAPWLTFCSLFSIIINYSDYDLRNNLNIDNN